MSLSPSTNGRGFVQDQEVASKVESGKVEESEVAPRLHPGLRTLRIILYSHLAIIALATAMTLLDSRGLLIFEAGSALNALRLVCGGLLAVGLYGCPLATVIVASQSRDRSYGFQVAVIAGDLFLALVQMHQMLPMVARW